MPQSLAFEALSEGRRAELMAAMVRKVDVESFLLQLSALTFVAEEDFDVGGCFSVRGSSETFGGRRVISGFLETLHDFFVGYILVDVGDDYRHLSS